MSRKPLPTTTAVPAPGAHGGDGARLAAALGVDPSTVLDLSASMNPCAPDVTELAARHLDSLRRYPDATAATAATAGAIGVDPDRVVLTNGGSEAIALVAQDLFEGDVHDPEFSLYRRHLTVVDAGGGRWRSNPNNPTGELAAADEESAVWDEAFWPIATGTWTRGDADRGATVVGSLTKLFACPGLRAGYVLAPDAATADRLRRRQPMWSVNGLACALVPELLARADLAAWSAATRTLQQELAALFRAAGYQVRAAAAPWVLVERAGDLRERLARAAILVRDCSSFGLVDTARVGVPGPAGLARVAVALAAPREALTALQRSHLPDFGQAGHMPATRIPGTTPLLIHRHADGRLRRTPDDVVTEEPLEIRLDGRIVATTLRTPGHDAELAVGLLHAEGVLDGCRFIQVRHSPPGLYDGGHLNTVSVDTAGLATPPAPRLQVSTAACGLCGATSIGELTARLTPLVPMPLPPPAVILGLGARVREQQGLFASTGGVHAAAVFGADGEPSLVREDVGRHNAVDKVVGRLRLDDRLPATGLGLFVSGRAGFELVQKAWAAGFAWMVAVGAPTSLSVETARAAGLALVGFAGDDHFNVYAPLDR